MTLSHYEVSIHAPVVGATVPARRDGRRADVSIHAPVVGATRTPLSRSAASTCFDPRPRGGGDIPNHAGVFAGNQFRSTPPWWGRHVTVRPPVPSCVFRSTPPWWGRPGVRPAVRISLLFRSTPPWWGRLCLINLFKERRKFRPVCETLVCPEFSASKCHEFRLKSLKSLDCEHPWPMASTDGSQLEASHDQWPVHVGRGFRADMFDPATPLLAEHVEAQGIALGVDDLD